MTVRPSSRWSAFAPIVLAAVLAGAVFLSTEWSHRSAFQAQMQLIESTRPRLDLNSILQRLVDAESAQRGYLLTGRAEYLEPYRNADADVLRALADLRPLYASDTAQTALLDDLTRSATGKLAEMATTIGMYDAGDHLGWKAVLAAGQGQTMMSESRRAAGALIERVDLQMTQNRAVVLRAIERGRLVVHATTLLALIWLIFFMRKNRALQQAQRAYERDLVQQRDALEQQVASRTGELRELNAHLQDVREVERSKLARLLHDDLGALLTSAKLDLTRLRRALPDLPPSVASRLEHLGSTIDQGVAIKRRVIEELSPSALHNLGLRAALEMLVADFRRQSGLDVTLDIQDVALADSPRIAVYRLVQECLDNLQRHAAAAKAHVVLRRAESQVLVKVADEGRGFDPSSIPYAKHGLRKLRHRIEALGGALFVISAPGRGTEVEARLPLAVPGWDGEAVAGLGRAG